MAEEGQVITVHTVDKWKEQFQKGTETRKLIAKKTPEVIFLKVDVDELKTLAEEWKIDAMPTFLFLKDGEEVDKIVGADKDDLPYKVAKHASA